MRTAIMILAASLAASASPAFAQDSPRGQLRTPIGVTFLAADEMPMHTALSREWAGVVETTLVTAPPRRRANWVGDHPVLFGTIVGAGAGLALAQVDSIGGKDHDPKVALIGAGAGAWGGLIASAVKQRRAGNKVSGGTKAGIIAGAVALVVLPVLACYGAGGCGGSS